MYSSNINLIVAMNRVGTIGDSNTIPWYIPADMQRFKALTSKGVVVMGRKTWESLPAKVRPLPTRENVVVTRQKDYVAQGAQVSHDLIATIESYRGTPKVVWIIGGAEIYKQALPYCEFAYVTDVYNNKPGDAKLDHIRGELLSVSHEIQDEPDGSILQFDFRTIRIDHKSTLPLQGN